MTLKEELIILKDRMLKMEIQIQLLNETVEYMSENIQNLQRKEGELENDN
jgi:hypothetical protein